MVVLGASCWLVSDALPPCLWLMNWRRARCSEKGAARERANADSYGK